METRERLATIAEAAALLMSFLLPLKFGSISGVPEMPMLYWDNPVAAIVAAWPTTLLAPFSAILLALCLVLAPAKAFRSWPLRAFALLWAALAGVSLLGFVNASAYDFALHAVSHCFGVGCYALSVCLLLERRPEFGKWLVGSLAAGAAISAASGLYQYFAGFETTRQFAYEQELKSGMQFLKGQFKTRLEESRVSADFTLSNSYAGYMVLTTPLLLWLIWDFASTVEPPKVSRAVLALPAAGVMLFLFINTGSRGAVLALGAAIVALAAALPFNKRIRLAALASLPFLIAAFAVMVSLGRGFKSMTFRFDYFIAAFKMMLAQPFAGTGWGDFFHDYMRIKLLVDNEAPHTPHDFPLHFGSQTGVLGFLLALALLLLPIVAGVLAAKRRADKEGSFTPGFKEALLLGYAAWAVHSLIEINFETPGSVCIAIAVGSLILCAPDGQKEERKTPPKASLAFLAIGFLTLAGGTLFGKELLLSDMAFARLNSLCDFRFMTKEEIAAATPERVMESLKACIELSPKSPFPWAAASDYMLSTGRFDDGETFLREAIKRSPERASFHFRLFLILSRDKARAGEALAELEKARSLFPYNSEYLKAEQDIKEAVRKAMPPVSVFNPAPAKGGAEALPPPQSK